MLLCKCVSWLISEVVDDDVVVIVFVFVGCVVVVAELLPVAEDEALELGMDVVVGSVRTETVVRVERVGRDGHGHGDDGA